MDSVDRIMGFVMPFLPVNLAEKQALLEIDSVRQRYITFLETLVKTRENINHPDRDGEESLRPGEQIEP